MFEKKNYLIWTDTGSHFRCGELYYYLFNELAHEGIKVDFNLFGNFN